MAILVNPTQRILFAHCAFDVALSPPRFPVHWLPFASFLILYFSCFGFCLLAAVQADFFSIGFKRTLLFVFFARPAPNYPILFCSTCTKLPNSSICPSFSTTAPAPSAINFSIQAQ